MRRTSIVILALIALLPCANLSAQTPGSMQDMDAKKHRELMPMHAQMMEMQKAQDAEIEKLRTEMNAATGEKRMEAIVAILNKLIEQRKAMHEKMAAQLD